MTIFFNSAGLEGATVGLYPSVANGGPFTLSGSQTNGTALTSTAFAYAGTKSLECVMTANATGNAFANNANYAIPAAWDAFYLQARVYLHTFSVTAGNALHSVFSLSNTSCDVVANLVGSDIKLRARICDSTPAVVVQTDQSAAIPLNTAWVKVLAILRNAGGGNLGVRLFVDDVEVGTEQVGARTLLANAQNAFGFRTTIAGSPGTAASGSKIYFDDIVFEVAESRDRTRVPLWRPRDNTISFQHTLMPRGEVSF